MMKSWTRTLNLDDAHSLLALATLGKVYDTWVSECHDALPVLSMPRRRELIRILRDGFLDWEDNRIAPGLFLNTYQNSSAKGQIDLVDHQWAMSHPLTLIAVESVVAPHVETASSAITLQEFEVVVAQNIDTESKESLRKTRTVLLGAMEGIGTIRTKGTGQHRSVSAQRGEPHPLSFGYLILRELRERGVDGMMSSEATESSLPVRLTQCTAAHAKHCLDWNLTNGHLIARDDEISIPH